MNIKPKCPKCGGTNVVFTERATVSYKLKGFDPGGWQPEDEPCEISTHDSDGFWCDDCDDYVGEPAPPISAGRMPLGLQQQQQHKQQGE